MIMIEYNFSSDFYNTFKNMKANNSEQGML